MNKKDIFWQTYLNLEKEVIEVSKYIFITDEVTVRKNGIESPTFSDSLLMVFSPYLLFNFKIWNYDSFRIKKPSFYRK